MKHILWILFSVLVGLATIAAAIFAGAAYFHDPGDGSDSLIAHIEASNVVLPKDNCGIPFPKIDVLYRVRVENKSTVPLTGVFLRFPDIAMVSGDITVDASDITKAGIASEIAIGTLKQRSTVNFYIWGHKLFLLSIPSDAEKRVVIGHDKGVGIMSYARR